MAALDIVQPGLLPWMLYAVGSGLHLNYTPLYLLAVLGLPSLSGLASLLLY